jgi:opacity protein-like surface antigen
MKSSLWGLLLFLPGVCIGQPDSSAYALFLKWGLSEYTYVVPAGIGGGRSSTRWNMGPTIGLGFQLPTSRVVSLVFVLDYSTNSYQTSTGRQLLNDARAKTVDFTVSAKFVGRQIYFAGGIGLSHTRRDEVRTATVTDSSRTYLHEISGEGETTLVLTLALGLEYSLTDHLSIFIQGDARLRSYSSFAVEAGVAYEL